MNNLENVDKYLYSLPVQIKGSRARLDHVRSVLNLLDNPQNNIPAIHIAGTSGKGSTAYYCSEMLKLAGYSVGLSVSPHVSSVAERAQINGSTLDIERYTEHFDEFRNIILQLGQELTYIEFINIFSFWLFNKLKLDYVVIEVGLGGRLDTTNVITRTDKVAVITDIGLDHTEVLGDTLDKIAAEKAGIIQRDNIVCMYKQCDVVMKAISLTVDKKNAKLLLSKESDLTLNTGLPLYQQRNWLLAKLAVKARLQLDKRPSVDTSTLLKSQLVNIPGRFEVFQNDDQYIILDSAHNPQKINALIDAINQKFPDKPAVVVVSFSQNKANSAQESLRLLEEIANKIIFTEYVIHNFSGRDALPAKTLLSYIDGADIEKDPYEALALATKIARGSDSIIIITGSFYLVSNLRTKLIDQFEKI